MSDKPNFCDVCGGFIGMKRDNPKELCGECEEQHDPQSADYDSAFGDYFADKDAWGSG